VQQPAKGRPQRLLLLGGPGDVAAGKFFDCAACIHVIEHVYHPIPFLREIHARLRPGGWLVLATPDAGAFWRSAMGSRWPFYKVPEHVTYFDRASLTRVFETAGFVDVAPMPYPSIFPLGLAAEKLGRGLPRRLRALHLRVPGATLCLAARRPAEPPTTAPLAA
jgi:SAM-dependent methyltransferase